jgi:N-acetylglutamate synthase-like GNAT family acetyltransferase
MIHIRQFRMTDLEELIELMKDLGYPTNLLDMKKRMEKILNIPMYNTFVAEYESKVVGMVGIREIYTYEEDTPFVQISAIVTSHTLRGRGVGKKLVDYVEKWAIQKGANTVFLTSGNKPERENAHAFYKNAGFEINGYRFIKKMK